MRPEGTFVLGCLVLVCAVLQHVDAQNCKRNQFQEVVKTTNGLTVSSTLSYLDKGDYYVTDNFVDSVTCADAKIDFDTALQKTSAAGTVLCSLAQLKKATGTWLDSNGATSAPKRCGGNSIIKGTVWSSTPCNGGFMSWNFKSKTAACSAPSDVNNLMSCTASAGSECLDCPVNSFRENHILGYKKCTCYSGFSSAGASNVFNLECTKSSVNADACGANTYLMYPSMIKCSSHSDTSSLTGSSCGVHTTTRSECTKRDITHTRAEHVCRSKGARLCTKSEIDDMTGEGSEGALCSYERKGKMWSGERCHKSNARGHAFYYAKDLDEGSEWSCVKEKNSENMGFRCCADDVVEEKCLSCGGSASSSAGSKSFDSCTCEHVGGSGDCIDAELDVVASCDANMYTKTSKQSCKTLMSLFKDTWIPTRKRACATFQDGQGKCFEKTTHEDAVKTCQGMGARLCRWDELNEGQLSGLRCNDPWVRTSSKCCDESGGKETCDATAGHSVIGTKGTSPSKKRNVCQPDSHLAKFACCADSEPAVCKDKCPPRSESPQAGDNTIDDCVCTGEGYMLADNACKKKTVAKCGKNEFSGGFLNIKKLKLKPSSRRDDTPKDIDTVAATSNIGDYTCAQLAAKSYVDAVSICRAAGMRLCRNSVEMEAGLFGRNDGCNVKGTNSAWTSFACDTGRHFRTNTISDVCADDTSTHAVVCCADPAQNKCHKCDEGAQSAAQTSDRDGCSCESGLNPSVSDTTDPMCAI